MFWLKIIIPQLLFKSCCLTMLLLAMAGLWDKETWVKMRWRLFMGWWRSWRMTETSLTCNSWILLSTPSQRGRIQKDVTLDQDLTVPERFCSSNRNHALVCDLNRILSGLEPESWKQRCALHLAASTLSPSPATTRSLSDVSTEQWSTATERCSEDSLPGASFNIAGSSHHSSREYQRFAIKYYFRNGRLELLAMHHGSLAKAMKKFGLPWRFFMILIYKVFI